jgi:predicted lipoprotein
MRRTSWGALGVLAVVAAAIQPGGCAGPVDGDGTEVTEVEGDVLGHTRDTVVGALGEAELSLDALSAAVDAWAASPDDDAARAAAQQAFMAAFEAWAVVEVYQVGPAAPALVDVAGQDLRDAIYSWPTVNPCRVDQETVSGDYANASFFDDELVNVMGFDALEHLLFAPEANACPGQVDINANGSWDALGSAGVASARAAYAAAVVGQIQADVGALSADWTGGFGDEFVASGAPYESADAAIDAVYRAAFYVELMKDDKLALPVGLRGCATATCPELAESQAAAMSSTLLRANLRGLRALLVGDGSQGFYALLVDAGDEALANTLVTQLDAAEAALADLAPIPEALSSDAAQVIAAYDAVAALATTLEGDVATGLTLAVPVEAAGDND